MIKQDLQGRQIVALHDVRGAVFSASASVTTGTATALTGSSDADYFMDIIEATFANNSGASVGIDLLNDGTISRHIELLGNTTLQIFFDVPLKQITKGTPWNIDLPDITGTTVTVGATLIKKDNK